MLTHLKTNKDLVIGFINYKNLLKDTRELVFSDSTEYYFSMIGEEVIGFHGVLIYANKVVSQCNYVVKKHRGKGYFKQMLDMHIRIAKEKNVASVEATCTSMSIREYLKRGFKIVKLYKIHTKVRLQL